MIIEIAIGWTAAAIPAAVTWADQVQAWGTVAGASVALIGIWAIYSTVSETRKQQRTQAGPYVRVDLGVLGKSGEDFQPPEVYYSDSEHITDLDEPIPNVERVTVSAWLRNYQAHNLGFALGVNLRFVARRFPTTDENDVLDGEVAVAYLEHAKPVRIDLVRANMPANSTESIVVFVEEFAYYDFYDELNYHAFEEKSTNASHGRLTCVITMDGVTNLPEAWRRGEEVIYDE